MSPQSNKTENTSSCSVTEVKQHQTQSILRWGIAWEHGILKATSYHPKYVLALGNLQRLINHKNEIIQTTKNEISSTKKKKYLNF